MIVVIPTARDVRPDFIAPLLEYGARILVVNDTDNELGFVHPNVEVLSLDDRRKRLGRNLAAIPHGNGACRDFGFYVAWHEAEANEVIVAIDDDCIVRDRGFPTNVIAALGDGERPVAVGDGRHFNCLDVYDGVETGLYPRGFPYSARADYRRWTFDTVQRVTPDFNLGLWQNIFDVNAVDKIAGPSYVHPDAVLQHPTVVVPPGALVSACSMNMHFRKELIPAVYQLPMKVEVMPGYSIDRYGDIWGGFILKALMDIRRDVMTVGGPMIFHAKEGDYANNIRQEHLCHLVNDEFLTVLAESTATLGPGSYLELMAGVHDGFSRAAPKASPILSRYLRHLAGALGAWIDALAHA